MRQIMILESLVGKLGGDEPYYLSDEVQNFEIYIEDVDQVMHKPVRRKKTQIELCLIQLLKRLFGN